jgi:hypothetical protein
VTSGVASRDHYLTLALFSRRIIEALKELVQQGKRERLQTALPAAIESLQAATDSRHHLTGYGLRVARSYDQVRTINELFPQKEDKLGMIETLKSLQGDATPDVHAKAVEAIKFFYAIENRALRNYRHPSPRAHISSTK